MQDQNYQISNNISNYVFIQKINKEEKPVKTCDINEFIDILADSDNVYLTSNYIVAQNISLTTKDNGFFSYLTSEDSFFELSEERLKVCCNFINNGLGGLGKRIKTLSSTRRYIA